MQASLHPVPAPEAGSSRTEAAGLIYDLRSNGDSSIPFYQRLACFSTRSALEIELHASDVIDKYSRFLKEVVNEPPRSRGEYGIEFLTLGMVQSRYAGAAQSTPRSILKLVRSLYLLRHTSASIKSATDRLRATITGLCLVPKIGCKANPGWNPLRDLPGLIEWIRATGEFEQEAARLDNWQRFLFTLPTSEAKQYLDTSKTLFHSFQIEAEQALATYTQGVHTFLSGEHLRRGHREDQIFCGKLPVEYHLNMVASEIMNRGLRDEFVQKPRKVVLIPACMRGPRESTCLARVNGTDITCAACDPSCPVNSLTRRMKTLGVPVFLVPHSTGFSRWLERWQKEPEYAVAAVACLLNILAGGYEMRARGISSQCVPLDYPGCQKHWCPKGIGTAVNEERLVQLVTATK